MANTENGPRYAHDCNRCKFLGRFDEFDLYHCEGLAAGSTVLARWSNDGADYQSGMNSSLPALVEAQRRAALLKLPTCNSTVPPVVAVIAEQATDEEIEVPPDPEEMNDRRADAAENVLRLFTKDMGEEGEGLEVQNLTDLISDFAHYCDRQGIQFAEILRMASFHYNEETDNEGQQRFSE